jgi:hypothetical protein
MSEQTVPKEQLIIEPAYTFLNVGQRSVVAVYPSLPMLIVALNNEYTITWTSNKPI